MVVARRRAAPAGSSASAEVHDCSWFAQRLSLSSSRQALMIRERLLMKTLLKTWIAASPFESAVRNVVERTRALGRVFVPKGVRVRRMRDLWNAQSRQSRLGYISHLRSGAWDQQEFELVGDRFVARMLERFEEFGSVPLSESAVLEIGCGVGRFLRPLSSRFSQVTGVDISEEMLQAAREYCRDSPNVRLVLNDGTGLREIKDASVDYVVSAGVFQHITDFDVIVNYLREAIRVLKPGGILLFQFEGNRTEAIGAGQIGARITARDLDRALRQSPMLVREVTTEAHDPVRNVVCVVEKAHGSAPDFAHTALTERSWLLGVYDGIKTQTVMHDRLCAGPAPLNFHD